jgi:hypothetical protein
VQDLFVSVQLCLSLSKFSPRYLTSTDGCIDLPGVTSYRPLIYEPVWSHHFRAITRDVCSRRNSVVRNYQSFRVAVLSAYHAHFNNLNVMVIVLAIRPKVRGFKPGREQWLLRAIKIRSTTSFGREVKQSAPCCKILQHVKDPCGYEQRYRQNSPTFLATFLPASLPGDCCNQSRENWWMNQEWLELRREAQHIIKW